MADELASVPLAVNVGSFANNNSILIIQPSTVYHVVSIFNDFLKVAVWTVADPPTVALTFDVRHLNDPPVNSPSSHRSMQLSPYICRLGHIPIRISADPLTLPLAIHIGSFIYSPRLLAHNPSTVSRVLHVRAFFNPSALTVAFAPSSTALAVYERALLDVSIPMAEHPRAVPDVVRVGSFGDRPAPVANAPSPLSLPVHIQAFLDAAVPAAHVPPAVPCPVQVQALGNAVASVAREPGASPPTVQELTVSNVPVGVADDCGSVGRTVVVLDFRNGAACVALNPVAVPLAHLEEAGMY